MTAAPEDHGSGRDRDGGLTLIEVMVSVAILSTLFMVILRSTVTVGDSNSSMESFNLILIKTQAAVAEFHEDVATARRMYEEDALGRSYVDAMNFGTLPPIASNLLPIIEPLGEFDQDTVGDRKVGNFVLMVGEMAPYDFTAPSNGRAYRVNVYRLVAYYIVDFGSPVAAGLSGFDLARWESTAFADYGTLLAISDAVARQELVQDMVATGRLDRAWDPAQPANAAFYLLDTDVAVAPDPSYQIPSSPVTHRLPKSFYRKYNAAIAPNNPPAPFASRSTLEAMRAGRNICALSMRRLSKAARIAASSTAAGAANRAPSASANRKPSGR